MGFMKMDRATARYLIENMFTSDEPFDFKCCEECGSHYPEEAAHFCGDSVDVETHDIKEGDVIEPVRIMPKSFDEEREEVLDNVFDMLGR